MRRLVQTALVVCTFGLVPLARADDAAKPALPKPAQALVDAFKSMTGTWACKGRFPKKDGSGTLESNSTMVIKPILNGFAYSGEVTVAKGTMMPVDFQQQFVWSYNAVTKKLVQYYVDSFGGTGQGTSDGLVGDTVIWDEETVKMGTPTKSRTTVRISPTEVDLTFDFQMDGKWATVGTKSCTKP
jgi:hypothetical protein